MPRISPRWSTRRKDRCALQVCPDTLEFLAKNGIQVEILQTEAAVDRFNELREEIAVGGLFHSTC